jgi:hypothetical protein
MGPSGLGTKNDCAGENQQQFTPPDGPRRTLFSGVTPVNLCVSESNILHSDKIEGNLRVNIMNDVTPSSVYIMRSVSVNLTRTSVVIQSFFLCLFNDAFKLGVEC